MYHIIYKDPMTGNILEAQGSTLNETVELIEKIKSDLYHKGVLPLAKNDLYVSNEKSNETKNESPAESPAETVNEKDDTKPSIYDDESTEDSNDFLDSEDFWYPYGVYQW